MLPVPPISALVCALCMYIFREGGRVCIMSPPSPRCLRGRSKSAGEELGNKMVARTLRRNATGPNSLQTAPLAGGRRAG